jgi:hypothetical protein
MSNPQDSAIRTDIPHSARIWNFWMGGKDNLEVDRVVGEASLKIDPDIAPMAVQCPKFLIRAVRYLASEGGIRQFPDIGTGLPAMQNTHEVAQAAAPESKIVYVDMGITGCAPWGAHPVNYDARLVADRRWPTSGQRPFVRIRSMTAAGRPSSDRCRRSARRCWGSAGAWCRRR